MQFDGEGSYVLVPYQKSVHMQRFSIWTRLNNILRAQTTPRALDDWVKAVDNVGRLVRQVKKSNDYATSYGCLWLTRAFLLAEMRAAKHSCLTVGKNDQVKTMTQAFSDQCQWLTRFGSNMKLRTLLRKLAYTDPPEMLTIDLCILGGPDARKWTIAEIKAATSTIRLARQEMGHDAHPLRVLKQAMRT